MIGFFIITVAAFFSMLISTDLIKNHLSKNYNKQSIHVGDIPRIGGIIIFILFFLLFFFDNKLNIDNITYLKLILSTSIIFFIINFLDDLKIELNPFLRIFAILISSLLFIIISEQQLNINNYFGIKYDFIILNLILSAIVICCITLSFNIIDGLNGLTSGIYLINILMINYLFYNGDNLLLIYSFIIVGMFFLINLLSGKIFLGDSGSHFLGFFIIIIYIKTINGQSFTNYNFIITCLWYPIADTLFSVLRRIYNQKSIWKADNKHFHTLIYYFIYKQLNTNYIISCMLSSLFIILLTFMLIYINYLFYENIIITICINISSLIIYLVVYFYIYKFNLRN